MRAVSRINIVLEVQQGADGSLRPVREVSAPSLYLDTSDLSYLILGQLGPDEDRPRRWRERLMGLLEADRVRLRLSIIHAAEMALTPKIIPGALDLIDTAANLYFATTSPVDIFKMELDPAHSGPVVLSERRFGRADLEGLRIPLRFWPRGVSGRTAARFVKLMVEGASFAESLGKRAALRDQALAPEERSRRKKLARSLMKGNAEPLPTWIRPVGQVAGAVTQRVLARRGLPSDLVERVHRKDQQGTAWAASISPESTGPRRDGRGWNADDVVAMPASTLRACVERAYRADLRRPPDAGTAYDVQHLAYVGYSDFSTIDGANIDAIKSVGKQLPHLSIFPTGDLEPVLDAIEAL